MEVLWLGHSCFRLRGRRASVVTDPCARSSGYNLGRVTAELVTVSNSHPHHSAVGEVTGDPIVLDGAGEYEVAGVVVTGFRTDPPTKASAEARNIAYIIEIDEVTVCHLGDLANPLTAEHLELTKDIDILMVPVGGNCTVGAAQAVEVISQLEPKIVVPMHYATDSSNVELEPLDRFLREMGITESEPVQRLNVSPSTLPPEPAVVVLQHRH